MSQSTQSTQIYAFIMCPCWWVSWKAHLKSKVRLSWESSGVGLDDGGRWRSQWSQCFYFSMKLFCVRLGLKIICAKFGEDWANAVKFSKNILINNQMLLIFEPVHPLPLIKMGSRQTWCEDISQLHLWSSGIKLDISAYRHASDQDQIKLPWQLFPTVLLGPLIAACSGVVLYL